MFKAIVLLIIAMVSIQCGATLAKGLFPTFGAAGISTLRLMFASILMGFVFRPWQMKLTRLQWKMVMIYGLALGLMNFSFYFALERIPLGIAVALEFTGPLAVAVFGSKRVLDYLWILLAGLGIWLLLPHSPTEAALDIWGIVLALTAGFFWAMYILFGKKAGGDLPGHIASSFGMFFAALIVSPFGVFIAQERLLQFNFWPYAFVVAIFSSALPYTLEMYSLKKIPSKTFGILMSLEPAIGALAGLFFLHEQLIPSQWIAIVCVMMASFGSTLTSTRS